MNAAIWHDGTNHESSKTVLKNCTFEGDKGYKLGRYHRPAQFYLLDCKFDENMADAPIYHVSSGRQSDGRQSDGRQSDGRQSDGRQSDGRQSDGRQSDGRQSDSPEPKWGHRVYYQNCHRKGGDYTWHANNFPIDTKIISLDWAFDGQWKSLGGLVK